MNGTDVDKNDFCVLGVNFKKADYNVRGKFSLFYKDVENIVNRAKKYRLNNFFIISTCNRTEFYGFIQNIDVFLKIYFQNELLLLYFKKYMYVKKGREAVRHFLEVCSGLDSQILGDNDIIYQVKRWFSLFKNYKCVNSFLERLVNIGINVSKKVKNTTGLSDGSSSISYTAVNFIRQYICNDIKTYNILLYGIGKLGRNTCENLLKHYPNIRLTIINRTLETAINLKTKYNVIVKPYQDLINEINNCNIMIVSTGSSTHTVTEDMILKKSKKLIIIDLSVPSNVSREISNMKNIKLISIDDLSNEVDNTLLKRRLYIPQVNKIIDESIDEFFIWIYDRQFVIKMQKFKNKLNFLKKNIFSQLNKDKTHISEIDTKLVDNLINKISDYYISYLRSNRYKDNLSEIVKIIEDIFHLK